jgi:hypothetical protein
MTSVRRPARGLARAAAAAEHQHGALAGAWDGPRWQLVAVSLWMAVCAWAVVPRRLFLALTYPLVVAGLAIVGADFLRSANLLELLAVAYTFREAEIRTSSPLTSARPPWSPRSCWPCLSTYGAVSGVSDAARVRRGGRFCLGC